MSLRIKQREQFMIDFQRPMMAAYRAMRDFLIPDIVKQLVFPYLEWADRCIGCHRYCLDGDHVSYISTNIHHSRECNYCFECVNLDWNLGMPTTPFGSGYIQILHDFTNFDCHFERGPRSGSVNLRDWFDRKKGYQWRSPESIANSKPKRAHRAPSRLDGMLTGADAAKLIQFATSSPSARMTRKRRKIVIVDEDEAEWVAPALERSRTKHFRIYSEGKYMSMSFYPARMDAPVAPTATSHSSSCSGPSHCTCNQNLPTREVIDLTDSPPPPAPAPDYKLTQSPQPEDPESFDGPLLELDTPPPLPPMRYGSIFRYDRLDNPSFPPPVRKIVRGRTVLAMLQGKAKEQI